MAKFNCNVVSYVLRRAVDVTVIVPTPTIPEISKKKAAGVPCLHTPAEPYPVLYLLHGMGNNQATWNGYTNIELYAEERQIAVVCPSAENKGYIPVGKDDYFTFMTEELPDFVCGMFPISRKPEDTYLAGLSMGGIGTFIYGFNLPERYAAMGVFSAARVPLPKRLAEDPAEYERMKADGTLFKEYPFADPRYEGRALAANLKAAGKTFPKLYYSCGKKDNIYPAAVEYRDYLRSLGADVTWDEMEPYGHEWRFWDAQIERFLDWIPRTDSYSKLPKRTV